MTVYLVICEFFNRLILFTLLYLEKPKDIEMEEVKEIEKDSEAAEQLDKDTKPDVSKCTME